MSELHQKLMWRYATKKMNPAKAVPQEKVERILEAVRLTASSSGLQPYEVWLKTQPGTDTAGLVKSINDLGVAVVATVVLRAAGVADGADATASREYTADRGDPRVRGLDELTGAGALPVGGP